MAILCTICIEKGKRNNNKKPKRQTKTNETKGHLASVTNERFHSVHELK